MIKNFRDQYLKFPRTFRILLFSTFIDRLGGALIFPFLSLYVAQKFNVGMTKVGVIFGVWSFSSLIGSMVGGALADKFGRKKIAIFGLISSAFSGIAMALVTRISSFYLLALIAGLFTEIGHPARQAMVADLLGEDLRAEGFSALRIISNLAITFGPAIGGLLAGVSYLLLFIIDAGSSTITALIFMFSIPETKPESFEMERKTILDTLGGYFQVMKDKLFMAFIFVSIIVLTVYVQMYSTLSVFLSQVHGIEAQSFGLMMSMNAAIVVLLQFWVTRKLKRFPPMLMMILASAIYGIGFTLFGLTENMTLFFAGMAIITIGEMIHIPVAQTLASFFAPEDMRARYMAVYGLGWAIPNSFAPLLAGLVMDNYDPNFVWYISGLLSLLASALFWYLHLRVKDRFDFAKIADDEVQSV